jgi:hypothetical protein
MLTAEILRELLDYDPETGVFTWLAGRRAGKIAGGFRSDGYHTISIGSSRRYFAQRLAFLYVYGRWPAEDVDHIDGNPSNNAIVNLREATRSQNLQNKRSRSNTSSGLKGVTWQGRKWVARIKRDGRNDYLGSFKTAEEAHAAYCAAAREAYGEFARQK